MEYLRLCSLMVVWIILINSSHSSRLSDIRYYGCFDDQADRALGTQIGYSYTIDICIVQCRQSSQGKYTFAGLQFRGECWCGENYDRHGITYKCYDGNLQPCSFDGSNVCGASYANSVFKVCPGSRYGPKCESNNPDCGNRGSDVNGKCLSTCPPGFRGAECDEACPEGLFGPGCPGYCGSRCLNNRCDSRLGYCLEGCKMGLVGPFCLYTCQDHNHIPTGLCPFCGHCKDSVCTGSGGGCYYQCPRDWEGDVCRDCPPGKWGARCEHDCHMNCPDTCTKDTGHCGVCNSGAYGDYCEKTCSSNCHSSCDKTTGHCDSCNGEYYGSTCEQTCGKCSGYGCGFPNGECQSCEAGFYTTLCNERCPVGCTAYGCAMYTGNCITCKPGLYGLKCAKKCGDGCEDKCNKLSGECDSCVSGKYGRYCNMMCGQCSGGWCNRNGRCSPCNNGYYGEKCNMQCSAGCTDEGCDKSTGDCNACESGFYGPKCENTCADGCEEECDRESGECDTCVSRKYGNYCNMTCGKCFGGQCNEDDGLCSPCIDGYFGEKCNLTCPDNCNNSSCNQTSGICYSCVSGYYGRFCDISCGECIIGKCGYENGTCTPCKPGYFGPSCNTQCNETCPDAGCDQVSGQCIGCNNGWYGDTCSLRCPVNCVRRACDQTSGNCTSGCTSPFYGPTCDQECPGCLAGKCDRHGVCVDGCVDGKTGALCNEACPLGTFGSNCSLRCHCAGDSACDPVSGRCDGGGCEDGWTGDDCQAEALQSINIVEIAAPAAVGILIIIVIITVVIVMLVRRKRTKKVDESHNLESIDNTYAEISNDEQPNSNVSTGYGPYVEVDTPTVAEGVLYENAQELKDRSLIDENSIPDSGFSEPQYSVVHKTRTSSAVNDITDGKHDIDQASPVINRNSVKPSVAIKPYLVKTPHDSARASESPPIPQKPAISCKPKTMSALCKEDKDTISQGSQDEAEIPDHKEYDEEYDENPYGCVKNDTSLGTKVEVENLGAYIQHLEETNGFLKEYEKLNHNKQAAWTVASNPKLKTKNRYRGIIAYDHSRVILSKIGDDPLTDYINANYIPSYTKHHAYIASQGVTKHNEEDFWRMIMEKGITVIVMLTNLSEGKKIKCLQYWPSKGSITVGDVKVSLVSESVRADCVIRVLKAETTRIVRTVTQFHYTDWPDHNVPVSPRPLVNLRWRVRRQTEGSTAPVLVHCSAGIGRTGTFLAVDRLLDEAADAGAVDVAAAVNTLRQSRINMVQNVNQYEFVYRAVLEGLTVGRSTVPVDEFSTYVQNLQEEQVKAQFDYVIRNSEAVLQDNNDGPEIKIPHLKSAVKCLNCPSAEDVDVFWEKIRLSGSKHVLHCGSKEDTTLTWLPSDQHPLRLSEITVKISKDSSKSEGYCEIEIEPTGSSDYYNVEFKPKDPVERSEYMNCGDAVEVLDNSRRIKFYHVKCDFEELREIYTNLQGFTDDNPLLMIRGNDNSRTGVCIVALLLMEQADVHQEVDVMDAAVTVQLALSGVVKSVESYKELLDATSTMLKR